MLGHAITTELQLRAAREHAADLAATFRASHVEDSAGDRPVRAGRVSAEQGSRGSAEGCHSAGVTPLPFASGRVGSS